MTNQTPEQKEILSLAHQNSRGETGGAENPSVSSTRSTLPGRGHQSRPVGVGKEGPKLPTSPETALLGSQPPFALRSTKIGCARTQQLLREGLVTPGSGAALANHQARVKASSGLCTAMPLMMSQSYLLT